MKVDYWFKVRLICLKFDHHGVIDWFCAVYEPHWGMAHFEVANVDKEAPIDLAGMVWLFALGLPLGRDFYVAVYHDFRCGR